MSVEKAYFERMVKAYSAKNKDQYLRHVAEADELLRQHREKSVLGAIQSLKPLGLSSRRSNM